MGLSSKLVVVTSVFALRALACTPLPSLRDDDDAPTAPAGPESKDSLSRCSPNASAYASALEVEASARPSTASERRSTAYALSLAIVSRIDKKLAGRLASSKRVSDLVKSTALTRTSVSALCELKTPAQQRQPLVTSRADFSCTAPCDLDPTLLGDTGVTLVDVGLTRIVANATLSAAAKRYTEGVLTAVATGSLDEALASVLDDAAIEALVLDWGRVFAESAGSTPPLSREATFLAAVTAATTLAPRLEALTSLAIECEAFHASCAPVSPAADGGAPSSGEDGGPPLPDGGAPWSEAGAGCPLDTIPCAGGCCEQVKPPRILGEAFGSYVSITFESDTPGADVFYTSDGTNPTTSSLVWGGSPIVLPVPVTVTALAMKSGALSSDVVRREF